MHSEIPFGKTSVKLLMNPHFNCFVSRRGQQSSLKSFFLYFSQGLCQIITEKGIVNRLLSEQQLNRVCEINRPYLHTATLKMSLLNESHFIKECSITCRKRTDCINTSSHFLNNTQYVVALFLFEFLLCTLRKTCISNITIIQTLRMIKPQALLPSKLHLHFLKQCI